MEFRWNQCPVESEPQVEPGPEDFIAVLSAHPIVQLDLWPDLPSYSEAAQMGPFLIRTTPLPPQLRTSRTEEDRLEDRDGLVDEPIFPGEDTSSEEDDNDHNELEDDPSQRKPALRPDQILFHLLPDDGGNDCCLAFLSSIRSIFGLKSSRRATC
jgi:hypothetical protein